MGLKSKRAILQPSKSRLYSESDTVMYRIRLCSPLCLYIFYNWANSFVGLHLLKSMLDAALDEYDMDDGIQVHGGLGWLKTFHLIDIQLTVAK